MPPTALKIMRQVENPGRRYDFTCGALAVEERPWALELLEWGKEVMGVTINEFYGQTEVNLVVGNCAEIMEIRPGSWADHPGPHCRNCGRIRRAGSDWAQWASSFHQTARPVMFLSTGQSGSHGRNTLVIGALPATWPARMKTGTYGLWGEKTMSSPAQATG
jgi:hypothetical protein